MTANANGGEPSGMAFAVFAVLVIVLMWAAFHFRAQRDRAIEVIQLQADTLDECIAAAERQSAIIGQWEALYGVGNETGARDADAGR